MISGIYQIVNTKNGKQYIGSTKNFEKRQKEHFDMLANGKHNIVFQRAYDKYGEECFRFEIIEHCSESKLFEREEHYIDFFNSWAKNGTGYNVGSVGGGDNLSNHPLKDEIVARIANTIKTNRAKLSKEERKAIWGKSGKQNPNYSGGHRVCECGNSKQPHLNKCNTCEPRVYASGKDNSFYGKNHTDETKQLLSEKRTEYYNNLTDEDIANHPQTKAVSVDSVVYPGLSKAARENDVTASLARYRCLSKSEKWKNWFYV